MVKFSRYKTLILSLLILFNTFSSSADEHTVEQDWEKIRSEKWGAGDLKVHLLLRDGGTEEIALTGFIAGCDGYENTGVRISRGGVTTDIKWGDIRYIVPLAGAVKPKEGKELQHEALKPESCGDAYLAGNRPKSIYFPKFKTEKWVDEGVKIALNAIKVIAFSPGSLSDGVEAARRLATEDMVFVPGGCFQMGDVFGGGDGDEKPTHEVCVDDFYIGRYEVKQNEWWDVMGNHPSYIFRDC